MSRGDEIRRRLEWYFDLTQKFAAGERVSFPSVQSEENAWQPVDRFHWQREGSLRVARRGLIRELKRVLRYKRGLLPTSSRVRHPQLPYGEEMRVQMEFHINKIKAAENSRRGLP